MRLFLTNQSQQKLPGLLVVYSVDVFMHALTVKIFTVARCDVMGSVPHIPENPDV